jgi:hypothetical protein
MSSFLPLLVIGAMAATAAVLLIGVVGFAFSTRFNKAYANKIMAARVMLQGVAIALFALLILTHSG